MVEGSRGFAFEIATKSQDGTLRVWRNENQKPFNLVDLVKLGKWKDRPIPGGADTHMIKGRHPSDILHGQRNLHGSYDKDGNWLYDLDAYQRRLNEYPRADEGVTAGDILTTTGVIKQ